MGFLAWNVYGWTKYHINYKLIFRFNYHYSKIGQVNAFMARNFVKFRTQILRRAAIFATILLILLLWYLIVGFHTGKLGEALDFVPKEIIPIFLWISFIVYMFFPNFKVFNGPGRRYVYNIIKLTLKSIFFIPVKFAVSLIFKKGLLKIKLGDLVNRSADKFYATFEGYRIYYLLLYPLLFL